MLSASEEKLWAAGAAVHTELPGPASADALHWGWRRPGAHTPLRVSWCQAPSRSADQTALHVELEWGFAWLRCPSWVLDSFQSH